MSMRPEHPSIPAETARVARAANPHGTMAMWVRDRLDGLWADEDFAAWYPSDGRLSLALARLREAGLVAAGGRQRTDSTHTAPRSALSYPRFSQEKLGGMFLGLMTYLNLKREGDRSMSGKYRLCSGV